VGGPRGLPWLSSESGEDTASSAWYACSLAVWAALCASSVSLILQPRDSSSMWFLAESPYAPKI
jgi:hypothetical protein